MNGDEVIVPSALTPASRRAAEVTAKLANNGLLEQYCADNDIYIPPEVAFLILLTGGRFLHARAVPAATNAPPTSGGAAT